MSVPAVTFFNNESGVGKTLLVYHLLWMFAAMGKRVVTIDLDPQANLTAAFLDEELLETLWERSTGPTTVYRAIQPLTEFGNVLEPILSSQSGGVHLVPGDVACQDSRKPSLRNGPTACGKRILPGPSES